MFWKRKKSDTSSAQLKPSEAKVEVKKPKKLSPKEILINQIEQLASDQIICYKLGETYGGDLVITELSTSYPEKGQKYIISLDKVVDGKPAGNKRRLWQSNKPRDIANWIYARAGVPFN